MTRFTKSTNGKYVVKGHKFEMLIGTRAQVWHGTAFKTSGGLTKGHLLQNKAGRIVSRTKHATAKKEKRLVKAGYGTRKGKFGFVMLNKSSSKSKSRSRSMSKSKSRSRSRKMRGGNNMLALSPTDYDGRGVGTSGVDLQFVAGNAN
jgi:DVNP family